VIPAGSAMAAMIRKGTVVVLGAAETERHNRSWSSPEVHIWRMAGNQAMDFRESQGDEQAEDEL
jgi:uncharacterized protein